MGGRVCGWGGVSGVGVGGWRGAGQPKVWVGGWWVVLVNVNNVFFSNSGITFVLLKKV